MVTGGHSTAHRNLCGVVECSFFYCGGRTGCGARRVLFVECYASSALCRVKVVECWACSPDLVGFGLARLWTIGQNRAKPSKKQPKPSKKQPKTSKKQHTPCKKIFFCKGSGVNRGAKPLKSCGDWHLQRQSQTASLPHLNENHFGSVSRRPSAKGAIQDRAPVPNFCALGAQQHVRKKE